MAARRRRFAERRRTQGFSQESLADQLGVDRSTVVRWERGETLPQPHIRPRLAALLAVEPDELTRLLGGDSPSALDDHVGLAEDWDRQRIVRAVEDPRRVDGEVVRYLEQVMSVTTSASRALAPAALIAAAMPIYDLIWQFRRDAPERVRLPLLGLASRCAQFVGRMYYEAADTRQALTWSDRALASAHQAGDSHLVAYTLMRRASLVGERGDNTQVVDLARASRAAARDLPAHLVSLSLRHEAQGHARAGELSECLRALAGSAESLQNDPGAGWPAYASGFSLPFHRVQVAGCYLDLGRSQDAVEILRRELPAWPASREKAYHLARLACAYAAEGCRDLADESAREASALAGRVGAGRAVRVLGGLAVAGS